MVMIDGRTERLRKALLFSGVVMLACVIGAVVDGALSPSQPAHAPETVAEIVLVIAFVLSSLVFWVCAMLHAWRVFEGRGAARYWIVVVLFGGNVLASLIYWLFYAAWQRRIASAV